MELYHHGVLGMKWGVRRYQNKDGSLTPAGQRHRDKLSGANTHNKAFNDALFGRNKHEEEHGKQYTKSVNEIKKKYGVPDDNASNKEQIKFWYGEKSNGIKNNWQYTDKAKAYLKEVDKIDYHKGAYEAYKKDEEEEKKNWETVEKNPKMREAMSSAKDTMTKINQIEEQTIGDKSEAYKKAYDLFKKTKGKEYSDPEDLSYAFDHYEWREGNSSYDKAFSEYKKNVQHMEKQLESQLYDVIKNGMGDSGMSKLSKKQISTGKLLVDQHIRFRYNN